MKITQLKCKQKYKQFKFLSIINSLKSEMRFFGKLDYYFLKILLDHKLTMNLVIIS